MLMRVKLISSKAPTAEHYKVSVVQTAHLIIQMWKISGGDLLSFTVDFQGIIYNRAVIRKLWQTAYSDLCLLLVRICAGPYNQTAKKFLRIKGKSYFEEEEQSNQSHSDLSHKPREDSKSHMLIAYYKDDCHCF